MVKCYLCSGEFTLKKNLKTHLQLQRCKKDSLDYTVIQEKLIKLEQLECNNDDINKCNNNEINKCNNDDINKCIIHINPIDKFDVSCIDDEKMKDLVIKYDLSIQYEINPYFKYPVLNFPPVKIILSEYIKYMICNKDNLENQCVKYISKRPPIYSILISDKDGNPVQLNKNIKDACEILIKPILNILKNKLKECLITYEHTDFEKKYYRAIDKLQRELNDEYIVQTALSSVLQNDIITNIQMKLPNF
jgi:hypothetical protein